MPKILVIEDHPKTADALRNGLRGDGFETIVTGTGDGGFALLNAEPFDLVVLDWMLPGRDGLNILTALRARGSKTPVLLLTARDAVEDRVLGLDHGADDYLVKPFAFAELLARIRALSRREPALLGTVLQVGDLVMDTATRQVTRAGVPVELTSKEFALLEHLMRHPNQVLSRTVIAEHVWNYDFDNVTNVIDVHVKNLRKKIDEGFEPKLIHTVRGAGYRLSDRKPG